ncbi:hypothetical protein BC829DRAFT_25774 [Chytridium lagenaria]|nr:hypothetical protein BC829DRAFT_25774 [Chytridium lagenaria]
MNAFFNAISGILRLNSSLHPGVFCNFGGYIGQWSIQASDLTTFALAVITFVVAQAAYNVETLSFRLMQVEKSVVWVALGLFLFPVVTATIGYSLVGMAPSGSWCWFARDPRPLATYVRYTLTHGPRILIIFSIVIMYTILFGPFASASVNKNGSLNPPPPLLDLLERARKVLDIGLMWRSRRRWRKNRLG